MSWNYRSSAFLGVEGDPAGGRGEPMQAGGIIFGNPKASGRGEDAKERWTESRVPQGRPPGKYQILSSCVSCSAPPAPSPCMGSPSQGPV